MKTLYLIYHEIRPAQSRYSYVVSSADFEQQCDFLRRSQDQAAASNLLFPELTFDDGHLSAVEHALPILQKNGLSARFFITAGWTGERAGYMSAADLRTLQTAGMSIGAHGWSHKLLTHCSAGELDQELKGAKAKLEDLLGIRLQSVSLPGGRANARVLRACQEAGYTQVFTSSPSVHGLNEPAETIGRLNVHREASLAWMAQLLDPESGTLARLQRTDRLKSTAKRLLGDRLYASLWSLANRQEADPANAGAHAS